MSSASGIRTMAASGALSPSAAASVGLVFQRRATPTTLPTIIAVEAAGSRRAWERLLLGGSRGLGTFGLTLLAIKLTGLMPGTLELADLAFPALMTSFGGIVTLGERLRAPWRRRQQRRDAQRVRSLARSRAGTLVCVEGEIEEAGQAFPAAASARPAVVARYRLGRRAGGPLDEVHAVPFVVRLTSGERLLVAPDALEVTDRPRAMLVVDRARLAGLRLGPRHARAPFRVGEAAYGPGDWVELVGELVFEPNPQGASHSHRIAPMAATLRPGPAGKVLVRRSFSPAV